jgi:hypothetical protein
MTLNSERLQHRRRFIASTILLAGFGCAFVIYLTAAPDNPQGYEFENTKQYLREIEVYGGTANLFATELREWFESLWHGRRLAVTVMCLTLVVLLFYMVASTPLPEEGGLSPHDEREGDQPEP